MNLTNLFEDDGRTPNPNYAEELAYQIFKVAPGLDTTGAADEVLDYAFDLAVNDLGRKRAHSLFAYDEDFDSDLVNAYLDLQMNQKGVAEGGPYDLPGIDYPRPGDTPAKPRHRGQQTPGVNPDDEAYFREIWRKNKLAQQQKEREADHERLATGINESKKKLKESVFLREDRQLIHEQWNKVGQHLVEYKLTPEQIQDLFSRIEKNAPDNRTMIGRGVDKATELNDAWETLKGKIQQSHPVKGFDDLYDKAAAKLKTATGGDKGVMQYINKYRDFAKKHPYIQSAVYAALIAAAGLSGAGLGGAGAIGLLKMTDRLLQGDKASSALYKGAKTGALAMAAHSIADYFKNPSAQIPPGTPAKLPDGSEYVVQKGDTLSQIAQKNGVSVKDLMAANSGQTVPTGDRITWNDPNAFTDVNTMGDAVPAGTGSEPTYDVRTKLTNPDVLQPGQKLNVPGSLGPTQTYADGVGTAADTWDKVKSGEYTPSEISRNQAAKWNLPGAGEYNPPAGARIPADQAPMFDPTGGAASASKPDYNKYDDGASQLKPSADMTKVSANAPTGAGMSPDYLNRVISGEQPRPMISADDAQKALDWQAQNGGQLQSATSAVGSGKGFSDEYLKSVINGTHPRPMISPEQAQKMLDAKTSGATEFTPKGASASGDVDYASSKTNPWERANAKVDADVAAQNAEIGAQNAKASAEYSDWLAKNPGSPVPYDQDGNLMPGWKNDPEKPGYLKFNAPKLKESQIYSLFDSVVAGQKKLNEGMWDSVKSAAGKAADWAKTKGHNLTTKVTLDKLLNAWNKLGKPTDSEQIRKILQNAGVNDQVIASVYSSMRIPVGVSAPAQQPSGRIEPTMSAPAAKAAPVATTQKAPAVAPAKSAATPAWADPKSAEYVGRREVARRMAAQPAPAAKPAAPQWSAGTGAYSTQAAKQQPGSKPVATPTAPAKKLTPAQYIQAIGQDENINEGHMSEIAAEYEDYKKLSPREFYNMYQMTKQQWLEKYKGLLQNSGVLDEDNGVKFAAEPGSKALGNANMGLLIKAYHARTPRITLHFGDRSVDLDADDIEAIAHYYDEQITDPNDRWNFIYQTMSNPDNLTATLAKIGRRSQKAVQQPGLFQEENKKKDELEPNVKDVALQRAITRAKADFPTAGSGLEALAKGFMRSQDEDQKSFDQIRQAERQQDQMLSQIAKIDQEQEQEIQDLDQQNSTLATRLQQLQNVNGQLEKKLAAMSGRGEKRKADKAKSASEPATQTTKVDIAAPKDSDSKPTKAEPKAKASKIPNVSYTINPTKVDTKKADTKVAPTKAPPKIGAMRNADVTDIAHRMLGAEPYSKQDELEKVAQAELPQLQNNPSPTFGTTSTQDLDQKQKDLFAAENKDDEAKYGNKYQSMVARVGQKAREQEKNKPVDIADLARRLAAIEASHKDK